MSMSDPIADMLTRIRNSLMIGHATVAMPYSGLKAEVAKVLQQEGYIEGFSVSEDVKPSITIDLKYFGKRRVRKPVISGIKRISTPGRRVYTGKREIPWVLSGMGIAILSTPKGVMTGAQARREGVGGEVLAYVW
ncbi:MAG: 30S ribosomal protein S8 [Chloroflexota bacterium]